MNIRNSRFIHSVFFLLVFLFALGARGGCFIGEYSYNRCCEQNDPSCWEGFEGNEEACCGSNGRFLLVHDWPAHFGNAVIALLEAMYVAYKLQRTLLLPLEHDLFEDTLKDMEKKYGVRSSIGSVFMAETQQQCENIHITDVGGGGRTGPHRSVLPTDGQDVLSSKYFNWVMGLFHENGMQTVSDEWENTLEKRKEQGIYSAKQEFLEDKVFASYSLISDRWLGRYKHTLGAIGETDIIRYHRMHHKDSVSDLPNQYEEVPPGCRDYGSRSELVEASSYYAARNDEDSNVFSDDFLDQVLLQHRPCYMDFLRAPRISNQQCLLLRQLYLAVDWGSEEATEFAEFFHERLYIYLFEGLVYPAIEKNHQLTQLFTVQQRKDDELHQNQEPNVLAVHLRQFARALPPSAALKTKIVEEASASSMDVVFLATNAPHRLKGLVKDLSKEMPHVKILTSGDIDKKANNYEESDSDGDHTKAKRYLGKIASFEFLVDLGICISSTKFLGHPDSTASAYIMKARQKRRKLHEKSDSKIIISKYLHPSQLRVEYMPSFSVSDIFDVKFRGDPLQWPRKLAEMIMYISPFVEVPEAPSEEMKALAEKHRYMYISWGEMENKEEMIFVRDFEKNVVGAVNQSVFSKGLLKDHIEKNSDSWGFLYVPEAKKAPVVGEFSREKDARGVPKNSFEYHLDRTPLFPDHSFGWSVGWYIAGNELAKNFVMKFPEYAVLARLKLVVLHLSEGFYTEEECFNELRVLGHWIYHQIFQDEWMAFVYLKKLLSGATVYYLLRIADFIEKNQCKTKVPHFFSEKNLAEEELFKTFRKQSFWETYRKGGVYAGVDPNLNPEIKTDEIRRDTRILRHLNDTEAVASRNWRHYIDARRNIVRNWSNSTWAIYETTPLVRL